MRKLTDDEVMLVATFLPLHSRQQMRLVCMSWAVGVSRTMYVCIPTGAVERVPVEPNRRRSERKKPRLVPRPLLLCTRARVVCSSESAADRVGVMLRRSPYLQCLELRLDGVRLRQAPPAYLEECPAPLKEVAIRVEGCSQEVVDDVVRSVGVARSALVTDLAIAIISCSVGVSIGENLQRAVAKFRTLQAITFHCSYSSLDDSSLKAIASGLTKLPPRVCLEFPGNYLSSAGLLAGAFMDSPRNIRKLRLDFSGNQMAMDRILFSLPHLEDLSLNLAHCHLEGGRHVIRTLQQCTTLLECRLDLTDSGLDLLFVPALVECLAECAKLHHLSLVLADNKEVNNAALASLSKLRDCLSLRTLHLDISGCAVSSQEAIEDLAFALAGLPCLASLNWVLNRCRLFDAAAGLQHLEHSLSLRTLHLSLQSCLLSNSCIALGRVAGAPNLAELRLHLEWNVIEKKAAESLVHIIAEHRSSSLQLLHLNVARNFGAGSKWLTQYPEAFLGMKTKIIPPHDPSDHLAIAIALD
eukprot:Sspe_Gene.56036::Locus_30829_Transcript_2_2_Confidence_0.400_Length_5241::g.56036::m.56036